MPSRVMHGQYTLRCGADYTLPSIHPREPEADVEYWPFVIVFPKKAETSTKKWNLKFVLKRLKDAGACSREGVPVVA